MESSSRSRSLAPWSNSRGSAGGRAHGSAGHGDGTRSCGADPGRRWAWHNGRRGHPRRIAGGRRGSCSHDRGWAAGGKDSIPRMMGHLMALKMVCSPCIQPSILPGGWWSQSDCARPSVCERERAWGCRNGTARSFWNRSPCRCVLLAKADARPSSPRSRYPRSPRPKSGQSSSQAGVIAVDSSIVIAPARHGMNRTMWSGSHRPGSPPWRARRANSAESASASCERWRYPGNGPRLRNFPWPGRP